MFRPFEARAERQTIWLGSADNARQTETVRRRRSELRARAQRNGSLHEGRRARRQRDGFSSNGDWFLALKRSAPAVIAAINISAFGTMQEDELRVEVRGGGKLLPLPQRLLSLSERPNCQRGAQRDVRLAVGTAHEDMSISDILINVENDLRRTEGRLTDRGRVHDGNHVLQIVQRSSPGGPADRRSPPDVDAAPDAAGPPTPHSPCPTPAGFDSAFSGKSPLKSEAAVTIAGFVDPPPHPGDDPLTICSTVNCVVKRDRHRQSSLPFDVNRFRP